MRKIKRRKGKNKVIIITSLCLLLVLTVGYAAFQTNLTLKAKGKIIVLQDLYVASYGSDTKGNGTREKPYATIQKAYNMAGDTGSIHILDNITQKETINFDKDKEITLDSVNNNSIIRDSSLTSTLLNINDGTTTFQNITFDGNNVEVSSAMIEAYSDIVIEDGAVFKNTYNTGDFGGALSIRNGNSIINGGEFFDNKVTAGGSALFIHSMNCNVTINGGKIHDNTARDGSIWSVGIITINDVEIYNNISQKQGGGIVNNGKLIVNGGKIYKNEGATGGGICSAHYPGGEDSLFITGGNIYDNIASSSGGGIYMMFDTTYSNTGGTIENNTPDNVYRAN